VSAGSGAPDPDLLIYPQLHESSAGVTQGHYYGRDEFHDWVDTARNSADVEERRELYINVVDEILEQKIAMPAYSLTNSYAVGDHINNLTVHPSSSLNPRLAQPPGVWTEEE
jgi:peptide/nickel transport system substrate-binding protein